MYAVEASLKPADLKILNTTATSVVFSWYPSNSNYEHIVAVNGIDTRVAKPGTFRLNLAGEHLLKIELHKYPVLATNFSI